MPVDRNRPQLLPFQVSIQLPFQRRLGAEGEDKTQQLAVQGCLVTISVTGLCRAGRRPWTTPVPLPVRRKRQAEHRERKKYSKSDRNEEKKRLKTENNRENVGKCVCVWVGAKLLWQEKQAAKEEEKT